MTATLDSGQDLWQLDADRLDQDPAAVRHQPGRLARVRSRLSQRRRSALVLVPLLLLATAVQWVNSGRAPQRIDDEGTYVAQAWAAEHLGSLGHYTYWYDHPPLGWLQIAAWTSSTRAFDRYDTAVLAGREFMLVVTLVSSVLLWTLARRLHLARWAACLAVALFALSPLAVQFHRTVFLDNVATPWVIAAFVLGLSPQRRLSAFAGSGLCFAVAVLTKETSLLLLPALAWQLWRLGRDSGTRRYGLAVAGSLFLLAGLGYVLLAVVKGELLPGPGHVSLVDGVKFQLFTRQGSGSILSPGTLGRARVDQWLTLDRVFPALAILATPVAFAVKRLRPLALGMTVLLVILFRPGYLPVPYVIALLPLGALLVAGVADAAWSNRPQRVDVVEPTTSEPDRPQRRAGSGPRFGVVAVAVIAVALAVPQWTAKTRGLLQGDLDRPMRQAETWIGANVASDARLVVDDSMWVDLVRQGRARENVLWYYKPDTDPAVQADNPQGWRDYDYVVSTTSLRASPDVFPSIADALRSSTPVAVFGQGIDRVEVRRVLPGGLDALQSAQDQAADRRSSAARQLATNPGLDLSPPARQALVGGEVDIRVQAFLAALSASGQPLQVADFPIDPAEQRASVPRRQVDLPGADPAAVRALADVQAPPYRPDTITDLPGGGVQITFGVRATPVLT